MFLKSTKICNNDMRSSPHSLNNVKWNCPFIWFSLFFQDPAKAMEVYPCPVYQSRIAPREPILELDVQHSGIPATRWALRGLSATIRPYWKTLHRVQSLVCQFVINDSCQWTCMPKDKCQNTNTTQCPIMWSNHMFSNYEMRAYY